MGADILLGLALAFVVLGPKRMHSVLGHVARAKRTFDKSAATIKAQLAKELEEDPQPSPEPENVTLLPPARFLNRHPKRSEVAVAAEVMPGSAAAASTRT